MSNQIKFSHNWNNKLESRIFTTIRRWTKEKEEYYRGLIANKSDVILKGKKISEAELQSVEVMEFSDIPDALIMYDTGLVLDDAQEVFGQFGLVKLPNHKAIILTYENYALSQEKGK